jgi:hypothetical protein
LQKDSIDSWSLKIFLEKGLRFISKVEGWRELRPLPHLSEMEPQPCDPSNVALKINKVWFDDPNFQNIVFSSWKKLQVDSNEPLMIQFENNLKNTKSAIKKWIPIWKDKKKKEISEIENDLSKIGTRLDRESLSLTLLEELRHLETK